MYRPGQTKPVSKTDEKLYKSFIQTLNTQGTSYDKNGLVDDSNLADLVVHSNEPVVFSRIDDGEILWYNAAYSNLAYEQGYRLKDVRNFAALKEFLKDVLFLDENMDLFIDDPTKNKFKYVRDLIIHRQSQKHAQFELFEDWISHIQPNGHACPQLRTVSINFSQNIYSVQFTNIEKRLKGVPKNLLETALDYINQKDPG